jgi:methyltransferase (TIGR00027 family)
MKNQRKTSETAVVTASLRALACYEEDDNIKCGDQIAGLFLPKEKRGPLSDSGFRSAIKKAIPEGLYEYVIARTRYFDELFIRYLKEGIPQIVILGAGYDSRPYRFENLIGKTLIYEVDAAATQEQKRLILQYNGIHCHRNIKYIACDFENDVLEDKLRSQGFNPQLLTLYIWEGVTFYLNPDTVKNMLKLLHANSAAHSMIGFDFQSIHHGQGLIDTGLKGEMITFGVESGMISGYLKDLGYAIIEHLNSEEMCKRYLMCSNGSLFGGIKPIMNIVLAETIY